MIHQLKYFNIHHVKKWSLIEFILIVSTNSVVFQPFSFRNQKFVPWPMAACPRGRDFLHVWAEISQEVSFKQTLNGVNKQKEKTWLYTVQYHYKQTFLFKPNKIEINLFYWFFMGEVLQLCYASVMLDKWVGNARKEEKGWHCNQLRYDIEKGQL